MSADMTRDIFAEQGFAKRSTACCLRLPAALSRGKIMETKKPRVRFCWECGAKLYGNHHKEIEIYGEIKIVHKSCTDQYRELRDQEKPYPLEYDLYVSGHRP